MKPHRTFTAVIAAMLLSIFSIQANAQHVNYGYDANGNRITRQYSANHIMNSTTPTDAEADQAAAHSPE